MNSSIPGSNVPNWIISPAGHMVVYIAEETRIASLLQRAVTALAFQGPMLDLLRKVYKENNIDLASVQSLIDQQNGGLSQWAHELIQMDYNPINCHGVVGLWVAVEVAVEDTAVLVLSRDPNSHNLAKEAGVKIPNMHGQASEVVARKIYARLEKICRTDVSVAEGYSKLLKILKVPLTIPPAVDSTMSELNYVRNCLMHRGGIVDERAATEAPGLQLSVGEKIKISAKRYLEYFDAVGKFSGQLFDAVVASPYCKTTKS